MNEDDVDDTLDLQIKTEDFKRKLKEAEDQGRQFGRTMTTALQGVALEGKSLGDVFQSLALSLSKMALQAAFKPLEQSIGSMFSSLLAGGIGTGGVPSPFAGSSGSIASPAGFPLVGGSALASAPASPHKVGGSGLAVTFNVTTPDVESFRRSEGQLAAMLARTVGQGQRNL